MKVTRRMNETMRRLRKAVQDVEVASSRGSSDDVNIAGRSNVVIAGTTGGQGSVHHASGKQTTRNRQINGQTVEESETISHEGKT